MTELNSAKGRESFDVAVGDSIIGFFNKNSVAYPTEVSAPKFELVPVTKQKDIMLNVARMHAQQEYDRIMEMVRVLEKQAKSIKRRLEITDAVHAAVYNFQVYHNKVYWLVFDTRKNISRLVHHGPNEWSTGAPTEYQYICRVKWLGDYSWVELDEEGNYVN